MALGPYTTATIRRTELDRIEASIDTILRNPTNLRQHQRGHANAPYWQMQHPGSLNAQECEELRQRYLNAGWDDVKVSNSGEDGERPGLIGITLYTAKPTS